MAFRAQMAEVGIDASGACSKAAGKSQGGAFDLVVTACPRATEACRLRPGEWPGECRRVHQEHPPAKVTGEEDQMPTGFPR